MCGRYTLRRAQVIRNAFRADFLPSFEEFTEHPRFNVAPTQYVPVVRLHGDQRVLTLMKWGLIPWWAKDDLKMKPINARAESLRTSPFYREPIVKRRCLMPVDGFYEWQGAKPPKQPHFFRRPNDVPFAFAAIWERWKPDADAEPVETCCLITTTPNSLMTPIHNRMPVLLRESDYGQWLDPKASSHDVKELLQPAADDFLETWPVSTLVNKPDNDGEELVQPLAESRPDRPAW